MSVLVVGLSHRSAPVSLLERAVLPADLAADLAVRACTSEHVTEAVVLSTCNRVEIYADVDKFHGGVTDLSERLAAVTGVQLDGLAPHLYVHYEDRAVQHLFDVACGLDSMVVGEGQIMGQVKQALRAAQEAGSLGRTLNELLQHALRVGKRARTETPIDRAGASMVSLGLELCELRIGALAGRSALVIGAGSMAALAAATLRRRGLGDVSVLNRTVDRALALAGDVGGRGGSLDDLDEALTRVDVVVSCTGAVGTVVPAAAVLDAQRRRHRAPLAILDLALPRDVEPEAALAPGVALLDVNALAEAAASAGVTPGVDEARRIVTEEVAAFLSWQRATLVAPTVVALRAMAADVVAAELARLETRTPGLDARTREEVAATVRRVVDKLLHAPTVRMKELAGEPGGHTYADALRHLFDLDPVTVAAVSRAAAVPAGPPAVPAVSGSPA